jgi:hypothetical protein
MELLFEKAKARRFPLFLESCMEGCHHLIYLEQLSFNF